MFIIESRRHVFLHKIQVKIFFLSKIHFHLRFFSISYTLYFTPLLLYVSAKIRFFSYVYVGRIPMRLKVSTICGVLHVFILLVKLKNKPLVYKT